MQHILSISNLDTFLQSCPFSPSHEMSAEIKMIAVNQSGTFHWWVLTNALQGEEDENDHDFRIKIQRDSKHSNYNGIYMNHCVESFDGNWKHILTTDHTKAYIQISEILYFIIIIMATSKLWNIRGIQTTPDYFFFLLTYRIHAYCWAALILMKNETHTSLYTKQVI